MVELMVVFVIIGAVLTFLIPMAYRASVESKYQLLRQTCTELASWANEWAGKELEIQPEAATSVLDDYMQTLGDSGSVNWVADPGTGSNWHSAQEDVEDRGGTGTDTAPNTGVKEIMPQNKILTNPFNGLSVFSSGNDPGDAAIPIQHGVTGAIGCAFIADSDGYNYYALLFQGTESTWTSTTTYTFYKGQDEGSIEGLRNGIFINRLMP